MKIEDMAKLKLQFPASDIEWRLQQCGEKNGRFWGKALAYITSRAVQERLDEVCGADGWQTSIKKEGEAYLCTLSIRVTHDDGSVEWISRVDGADSTDIEAVKGGISGAIKRAAVQFGIGRYLYNLEEGWAEISESGRFNGKTRDNKYFKWNPPALPEWALPGGSGKPPANTQAPKPQGRQPQNPNASPQRQPKFPETPQARELKNAILDWINKLNISGDSLNYANEYMFDNDINRMNEFIAWCNTQPQSA